MAFVITEPCISTCDTACVAVCPVEAFKEMTTYLIIDPDLCIDCNACVSECPVDAIYPEEEVPEDEIEWIEKNEEEAIDAPVATGESPVLGD